ncbi:MAG: hypothetical protein K0Q51_1132 [Rickettsiaceae bacterium]|jgi:ankyrin repeat protein|nr:hypothetical protein [Rickettsiaceae bacterium]
MPTNIKTTGSIKSFESYPKPSLKSSIGSYTSDAEDLEIVNQGVDSQVEVALERFRSLSFDGKDVIPTQRTYQNEVTVTSDETTNRNSFMETYFSAQSFSNDHNTIGTSFGTPSSISSILLRSSIERLPDSTNTAIEEDSITNLEQNLFIGATTNGKENIDPAKKEYSSVVNNGIAGVEVSHSNAGEVKSNVNEVAAAPYKRNQLQSQLVKNNIKNANKTIKRLNKIKPPSSYSASELEGLTEFEAELKQKKFESYLQEIKGSKENLAEQTLAKSKLKKTHQFKQEMLTEKLFEYINSNQHQAALEILSCNVDINCQNENGETPLHRIIRTHNNVEPLHSSPLYLRITEDRNLKPDIQDKNGNTILHLLADYTYLRPLRDLISELDENRINYKPDLKNNRGYTAVQTAVMNGAVKNAILLINEGASYDQVYESTQQNLLHLIAKAPEIQGQNKLDLVRLLLSKKLPMHNLDVFKKNPLHYAIESGFTQLIEFFIMKGSFYAHQHLIPAYEEPYPIPDKTKTSLTVSTTFKYMVECFKAPAFGAGHTRKSTIAKELQEWTFKEVNKIINEDIWWTKEHNIKALSWLTKVLEEYIHESSTQDKDIMDTLSCISEGPTLNFEELYLEIYKNVKCVTIAPIHNQLCGIKGSSREIWSFAEKIYYKDLIENLTMFLVEDMIKSFKHDVNETSKRAIISNMEVFIEIGENKKQILNGSISKGADSNFNFPLFNTSQVQSKLEDTNETPFLDSQIIHSNPNTPNKRKFDLFSSKQLKKFKVTDSRGNVIVKIEAADVIEDSSQGASQDSNDHQPMSQDSRDLQDMSQDSRDLQDMSQDSRDLQDMSQDKQWSDLMSQDTQPELSNLGEQGLQQNQL